MINNAFGFTGSNITEPNVSYEPINGEEILNEEHIEGKYLMKSILKGIMKIMQSCMNLSKMENNHYMKGVQSIPNCPF